MSAVPVTPAAHRRGGRRVAGQPRPGRLRRPGARRRDRAAARRAGRVASGGRPTTWPSTAGWSPGCRPPSTSTRPPSVEVRMDSKLVVEQMSGRWQIKHPDMKKLAAAGPRHRPAAGRGPLHLGAARAERRRRRAGQQRDGRQAGAPATRRPSRSSSRTRSSRPRARAGRHHARPTCCGTAAPSTPPSAGYSGRSDLPLSETGPGRRRAAAERLAGRGIEVVVSSPLRRTRQTAEAVAAVLGVPVEVTATWSSWTSAGGGAHRRRGPGKSPLAFRRCQGARRGRPGGESIADVSSPRGPGPGADARAARREDGAAWSAT